MSWNKAETRKAMLVKLKESAIDAKLAAKLGMEPLTSIEAKTELPGLPEYRAGFKIPYFDQRKKPTGHYRFRYLEPDLGFKAAAGARSTKYAQPKGSAPEVYIYPGMNWDSIFEDTSKPLYITEGELKSVCGCISQLATIGLGGVSMAVVEGKLLPLLAKVMWKGRDVYIVFDSDAKDNIAIRRAEALLMSYLTDLGAKPRAVRLPNLMGKDDAGKDNKTGLDDYLTRAGLDSFNEIAAKSLVGDEARELNRLAAEVIYISEPDIVYCPERNLRMQTTKFVTSHYSTWHYPQVVESDGKMRIIEKDTAKEYMRWTARPELDTFTFVPGGPSIVEDRKYNLWCGWPREPKKGDVSLWQELLDQIFLGKPAIERRWFEQWVAYPIQHPGAKLKQAILIWGGQGTGKSFLGEIIGRVYGPDNSTSFDNTKLNSAFNDWAESKQFALGEEIVVNAFDRGPISEMLKTLITGEYISIHRKYLNGYTLPNCMNMIIVSNHAVPIRVEHDDRRFFVIQVTGERLKPELYRPLDAWSKSEEGLSALMYYLKGVNLEGFDPNASAPSTEDKVSMTEGSSTALDDWLRRVKTNPEETLVMGKSKLNRQYWTAGELLDLFKLTQEGATTRAGAIQVSTAMSALRFVKPYHGPIKTATGTKKIWYVPRNGTGPAVKPNDIATAYDAERVDPVKKFMEAQHKEVTK